MNGQKVTRVVSLPGADSARFGLGLGPVAWRLGPGPQGSLGYLRTLTFHPEETEAVRTEAVVCLPCNALEVFRVPSVQ